MNDLWPVVGMYDVPKEIAEMLTVELTRQGYPTDWGYVGGRVVVRSNKHPHRADRCFRMFEYLYHKSNLE